MLAYIFLTISKQRVLHVASPYACLPFVLCRSSQFTMSYRGDIQFTEHVVVTISFDFDIDDAEYVHYYNHFYHDYRYYYIDYDITTGRGDIQIELVSPSGTRSVIFPYRPRDGFPSDFTDFPLMSVHFWGEDPRGVWSMSATTIMALQFPLTVSGVTMTVFGTAETPAAVARIPATCDQVCARGCAASGPQYCDACAESYVRNATTLECISECPSGFAVRSGYCYDPESPEPQCNNDVPDSAASLRMEILSVLLFCTVWAAAYV